MVSNKKPTLQSVGFCCFWDSKIFSMFEVYSKFRQVMEDKLLELLRNFYPTETFNGRNAPTPQRIQELILKGYKEGKNRAFLDEIEKKYGEKYRINTQRAFYVAIDEYVSMVATTRRFLPSV